MISILSLNIYFFFNLSEFCKQHTTLYILIGDKKNINLFNERPIFKKKLHHSIEKKVFDALFYTII